MAYWTPFCILHIYTYQFKKIIEMNTASPVLDCNQKYPSAFPVLILFHCGLACDRKADILSSGSFGIEPEIKYMAWTIVTWSCCGSWELQWVSVVTREDSHATGVQPSPLWWMVPLRHSLPLHLPTCLFLSLIYLGRYTTPTEAKHGSHFLLAAFPGISSKVPKPLIWEIIICQYVQITLKEYTSGEQRLCLYLHRPRVLREPENVSWISK